MSSHGLSFVCVWVLVSSHKHQPYWTHDLISMTSLKILCPNTVTFWGTGVRNSNMNFEGTQHRPQRAILCACWSWDAWSQIIALTGPESEHLWKDKPVWFYKPKCKGPPFGVSWLALIARLWVWLVLWFPASGPPQKQFLLLVNCWSCELPWISCHVICLNCGKKLY